ncbi:hypothetical protein PM082_007937 [Marasmius tenuissimus]|nr:hypothetical protein PM082_007937 [Marasmius tenuissimus]
MNSETSFESVLTGRGLLIDTNGTIRSRFRQRQTALDRVYGPNTSKWPTILSFRAPPSPLLPPTLQGAGYQVISLSVYPLAIIKRLPKERVEDGAVGSQNTVCSFHNLCRPHCFFLVLDITRAQPQSFTASRFPVDYHEQYLPGGLLPPGGICPSYPATRCLLSHLSTPKLPSYLLFIILPTAGEVDSLVLIDCFNFVHWR